MRPSFWLLSITIMQAFSEPAYSKCAMDKYIIAGKIKDCGSKLPLRDAMVFVFLDGNELAYGPTPDQRSSEHWMSSADGNFEVTTYFETLKNPKGPPKDPTERHDCSKIATKLEIFIVKAGYHAGRKEFNSLKIVQREINEQKLIDKFIKLPELCLEPRTDR